MEEIIEIIDPMDIIEGDVIRTRIEQDDFKVIEKKVYSEPWGYLIELNSDRGRIYLHRNEINEKRSSKVYRIIKSADNE